MIDLRQRLKLKREKIIDFIEGRYIPENITSEQVFNEIATELQTIFVNNHRGIIGVRDQAHNVLTMAIMCSMWCGWLSQAKANRNAYSQQWVNRCL
jgi:hypothetical protein